MDFLTILGFAAWWAFGMIVDIATHWAIHKEFTTYDKIGGVVMACFGPIWALVCYLALWSREHNGDLGDTDDKE